MFSRGDRQSIIILLWAFATISVASGLEMNCDKSDIYFNGMAKDEIDFVLTVSGFKMGVFPFRYLGIPISYKRMVVGDCTRLVEKVVERFRGWGARKHSYAGRLVLVKTYEDHENLVYGCAFSRRCWILAGDWLGIQLEAKVCAPGYVVHQLKKELQAGVLGIQWPSSQPLIWGPWT
ncbi:uncharacterized protein LOC141630621 [Silene latifolia]|uniref:uncharacterized protein LOC141630621 n=1 Tax=Silene latifolia TaxID=37657 RepID=UPI003D785564